MQQITNFVLSFHLLINVTNTQNRNINVFGFRPQVSAASALCAVCSIGISPLGSPCALPSFPSPARPFAAPHWLLLARPSPLFLCLVVFVAAARCLFFLFFLFLSVPPLSPAFYGFRPRVPRALALCVVCFVGLPLLSSPCALASFVFPARLLAGPWWLLPPLCISRFSSLPLGAPFFFLSLCAPVVSRFLRFPPPGALGLGAVCCLLCWPPAFRLSVRSRLFCVSRLAVGCSLVVAAPPPPPFMSRGFRRSRLMLRFFSLAVRPRCLWLSLVSGLGCPGPRRCVLIALLASRFSALRALSPLSCFSPGCWLLPGGSSPPPPPLLCLAVFVAAARCCVPCAVLCCVSLGAVLHRAAARCAPRCCAVVLIFAAFRNLSISYLFRRF